MGTLTWFRRILPWTISAGALWYVFGYAIDFQSIPEATAGANVPLFIAITVFDKIAFFLVWGLIQASVIRSFVEPVSYVRVLQVKGASELVRTANNSLADAAFLYGVAQLTRGQMATIVAVAGIPFGCHFAILLVQATMAVPFVEGGYQSHPGVASTVVVAWTLVVLGIIAARLGLWKRMMRAAGLGTWSEGVSARQILPFIGWFTLFAIFDVTIQGFASRAFGIDIPWVNLAAGIPILYFAISIPSLGNFGTREIAWANLFSEFGTRESLIAFALWTNVIFLIMHVLIGVIFLNRAITLVRELRKAREEGEAIPEPLLRDASDG